MTHAKSILNDLNGFFARLLFCYILLCRPVQAQCDTRQTEYVIYWCHEPARCRRKAGLPNGANSKESRFFLPNHLYLLQFLHCKDDEDVVEVVASLCGAFRIHQLLKLRAACFHSIRIQSLSMSFNSKSR